MRYQCNQTAQSTVNELKTALYHLVVHVTDVGNRLGQEFTAALGYPTGIQYILGAFDMWGGDACDSPGVNTFGNGICLNCAKFQERIYQPFCHVHRLYLQQ